MSSLFQLDCCLKPILGLSYLQVAGITIPQASSLLSTELSRSSVPLNRQSHFPQPPVLCEARIANEDGFAFT